MSKFMSAMSKLGLVDLEAEASSSDAPANPEDIERILAETRKMIAEPNLNPDDVPKASEGPVPEAAPEAAPAIDPNTPTTLEEQSFEEIYKAAGIAEGPYPAEKLLRVLDGLRAMDTAMRKAAIMAMDAADEDWTLEDPLLDATRKVKVLQDERKRVDQVAVAAAAQSESDLAAQDEYKVEAAATIRQQIAELETLLEQELQKVADEKASVMRKLEETKTACRSEIVRMDAEITRLEQLTSTFGTTTES